MIKIELIYYMKTRFLITAGKLYSESIKNIFLRGKTDLYIGSVSLVHLR